MHNGTHCRITKHGRYWMRPCTVCDIVTTRGEETVYLCHVADKLSGQVRVVPFFRDELAMVE